MPESLPLIDHDEIDHAASLLRAGKLVAFPTETVYGLGANALDADAVARIFAVKGRPHTSPLIVHVASIDMAKSLVTDWPGTAQRLAEKFWPGPLTVVLTVARVGRTFPSTSLRAGLSAQGTAGSLEIPPIVTAGLPTVGLRMPAHEIALALIRTAGVPLAAPSANRFTQLSPTTADHVRRGLGNDVDYILDGGPCRVGIESTVLSLAEPQPTLLRLGGIPRRDLEEVIGPIQTAAEVAAGPHPAPGMHPRHYSPRTRLLFVKNGELPSEGMGVYLQHAHPAARPGIATIQMPATAAAYAAALYDALHCADAAGYDWIAIDLPPQSHDWEAIHDRLRRAASK